MFACAHPALTQHRAPAHLADILGFDAAAIASPSWLRRDDGAAPGPRQDQDQAGGIRSACRARDLRDRLDAVLEAIYAAFAKAGPIRAAPTAGAATSPKKASGSAGSSSRCCRRSRGARSPGADALCRARRVARRNEIGDYVPLAEQDIALWDAPMIDEAEALCAAPAPAAEPGYRRRPYRAGKPRRHPPSAAATALDRHNSAVVIR